MCCMTVLIKYGEMESVSYYLTESVKTLLDRPLKRKFHDNNFYFQYKID